MFFATKNNTKIRGTFHLNWLVYKETKYQQFTKTCWKSHKMFNIGVNNTNYHLVFLFAVALMLRVSIYNWPKFFAGSFSTTSGARCRPRCVGDMEADSCAGGRKQRETGPRGESTSPARPLRLSCVQQWQAAAFPPTGLPKVVSVYNGTAGCRRVPLTGLRKSLSRTRETASVRGRHERPAFRASPLLPGLVGVPRRPFRLRSGDAGGRFYH